jgi:putative FmdB family regulatory protein
VPVYDLTCRDCGHAFTLKLKQAIKDNRKRCPECESRAIRQTLASYLRNGSLATQGCAPRSGFG